MDRFMRRLDRMVLVLGLSMCSVSAVLTVGRGAGVETLIPVLGAFLVVRACQLLRRVHATLEGMVAQPVHSPAMAFWRVEVHDKQWGLRPTQTGVFLPLEVNEVVCLVATVGGADTEEEH